MGEMNRMAAALFYKFAVTKKTVSPLNARESTVLFFVFCFLRFDYVARELT